MTKIHIYYHRCYDILIV